MEEPTANLASGASIGGADLEAPEKGETPHVFLRVSDPKRRAYLIAQSVTPSTRIACEVAGITTRTLYNWKHRPTDLTDPEAIAKDEAQRQYFLEACEVAKTLGVEAAEDEAWERAHLGWDEPVFGNISEPVEVEKVDGKGTKIIWRHRAGIVGHIRKKSDTMLIFMLKGAKPETYRERFEHTGAGGGPLQLQIVLPDNGRRRVTEGA